MKEYQNIILEHVKVTLLKTQSLKRDSFLNQTYLMNNKSFTHSLILKPVMIGSQQTYSVQLKNQQAQSKTRPSYFQNYFLNLNITYPQVLGLANNFMAENTIFYQEPAKEMYFLVLDVETSLAQFLNTWKMMLKELNYRNRLLTKRFSVQSQDLQMIRIWVPVEIKLV